MITTHTTRLNRMGLGLLIAGAFALSFAGAAQAHPGDAAGPGRNGKQAGKAKVPGKGPGKARGAKRDPARLLARLDLNHDGVLGPREIEAARPRLRAKLASADFNHDGRVTQPELRTAMKQWKQHREQRTGEGRRWKGKGERRNGKGEQWKGKGERRNDKGERRNDKGEPRKGNDAAPPRGEGARLRNPRATQLRQAIVMPNVIRRDHRSAK